MSAQGKTNLTAAFASARAHLLVGPESYRSSLVASGVPAGRILQYTLRQRSPDSENAHKEEKSVPLVEDNETFFRFSEAFGQAQNWDPIVTYRLRAEILDRLGNTDEYWSCHPRTQLFEIPQLDLKGHRPWGLRMHHNPFAGVMVSLLMVASLCCSIARADQGEALIKAARAGNLKQVQALLKKGVDVDAKNKRGQTALMSASERGHVEVMKTLLDKGADFDAEDENGATALMLAAEEGCLEVVRLLLERGAFVNAKDKEYAWTALTRAACKGRSEVVKLLRDRVGKVTLTDAACLGDVGEVERLIKRGARINGQIPTGATPLMGAIRQGRLEVAKILLNKGADVNAKDKEGETLCCGLALRATLKL